MQADDLWRFSLIEMAIHCLAHLLTKGVQGVSLGKDRLAQGPRGKTALSCFLDQENDFFHERALETPLNRRTFHDSTLIGKNPLGSWLTLLSSFFLFPSYFFLLTLFRRFQLNAHRRQTDLGRHETRVGIGDVHALPVSFRE